MLRHNQHTFYINLYGGAFCFIKKTKPRPAAGAIHIEPFQGWYFKQGLFQNWHTLQKVCLSQKLATSNQ